MTGERHPTWLITCRRGGAAQARTPLKIEKLAEPEPGPGELLIRIVACGVCHSDLHAIDGDWTPGPVLPLIPAMR